MVPSNLGRLEPQFHVCNKQTNKVYNKLVLQALGGQEDAQLGQED